MIQEKIVNFKNLVDFLGPASLTDRLVIATVCVTVLLYGHSSNKIRINHLTLLNCFQITVEKKTRKQKVLRGS